MRAVTAEEARRLDAEAISGGTPGIVLMERAAAHVAFEIERLLVRRPELGTEVVVLAGVGNNGGDGFETARLLERSPRVSRVGVVLVGEPSRLPRDARTTWQRLIDGGGTVSVAADRAGLEPLRRATLAIDALFGTGLTRPIGDGTLEAEGVRLLSAAPFTVAIDIPSGLRGGEASLSGPHVVADLTVTFGFPKIAHVLLPAAGECGRVIIAPIGLAGEDGTGGGSGPATVTARELAAILPRRQPESHKGTFGTVCVVGGSDGMAGAPALAARGAFRAGAGKVVVSAPDAVRPLVHTLCPEATTARPGIDLCAFDALAVGPGLGLSESSGALLRQALESAVPSVFDADALNLAGREAERFRRSSPTVLTPHPGEAARLLGTTTSEIGRDRGGAATELARRSGSVVVLKGFRSILAGPDGTISFVLAGNPGMATGGAGDVLTGVIAAFLARGATAAQAAAAGAYAHGLAGDLAREANGEEGLIASDLVDQLPHAFLSLRAPFPS